MKNKIIAVLVDKELSPEQKYDKLSQFLSQKINLMQARYFQLGYSDSKLEKLEYEVKKHYEISDTEIYEYQPEIQEEENTSPVILTNTITPIHLGQNPDDPKILLNEGTTEITVTGAQNETEVSEQQKQIISQLEENKPAKEGLKIRDQYPFLNDPNCPDEFKILVADKITAWKDFSKNHAALSEGIDENESEEKLYELAKSAVDEFELNDDIRKELDFYKTQGKVLGNHPKLNNLRIKQEISELTEAGLVEMKNKAQKNVSKAKVEIDNQGANENRVKRFDDWTLREKLATERLNTEFKK